jgi:secondary thiamine-phosphate synthase enzyme
LHFQSSRRAQKIQQRAGLESPLSMLSNHMRVAHHRIEVRTKGKGTYEITDAVQDKIDKSGVRSGTVTIFVQHTSCSLTTMENAAPAARRDVERFFERLVPEDADYEHDDEGPDDMPSHIRTVLTRTSETIPIVDRKIQLGTWQGIFLFEHRRDSHRREISLTIIGE